MIQRYESDSDFNFESHIKAMTPEELAATEEVLLDALIMVQEQLADSFSVGPSSNQLEFLLPLLWQQN